jgi:phage shock protein PspC (stress-responsive transcriptional regulator)
MMPTMDAPPIDPPPTEPIAPEPPEPDPPPAAAAAPRRLVRRADGRLLGGVARGVADYLAVDVIFVRLGFVVAAFFGGLGVIAYVVGWIVLPLDATGAGDDEVTGDRKQLLGYALVAVGLLAIGGRVGWKLGGDGAFWPLVLVGLGATVLWLRARDGTPGDSAPAPASPTRPPPPADGEPAAVEATEPMTVAAPRVPSDASSSAGARHPRERSYLGAITWSSLLVLAGVAWLLDASGAVDVDLGVVVALALALVGVALVISAWLGRARGLIALGIVLALAVGALGLVDVPLRGGIGDPTYHPRTVAGVRGDYALGVGNLAVDLRDVDFSGITRRVHAQVGIGQLDVTVPTGVRVVVDAHVGVGAARLFGSDSDECCPTDAHVVRGTPGGGTVRIDAEVGAGRLVIVRREESLRVAS